MADTDDQDEAKAKIVKLDYGIPEKRNRYLLTIAIVVGVILLAYAVLVILINTTRWGASLVD
jgi:vacuolar-type H+-ATPase subunit I/STV1